jgi:uncharacterized protein (TIGR04222 family)
VTAATIAVTLAREGRPLVVEPYLAVCAALLLGSVLARALPINRHSLDDDYEDGWDLAARELAYLRRGPYGVVLTVLAELHGRGALELSRGRVRRLDPVYELDDRLAVAVYVGLHRLRAPHLLALLPEVRRACAPLRWDLRERGLLPPLRRRVFAAALLGYAGALATATMLESDLRGSTVAGAAGVCAAAALLAPGWRRTVAGLRELRLHRQALSRIIGDEETYLADMVAAYGSRAIRELCGTLIPSGALAPPLPTYEPRPVAEPMPAPVVIEFPRFELPVPRARRLPVAA